MEMVNWATLLPDILLDVTKRLLSCDDFTGFIAFGGVCTSWRSLYMKVREDIMTPTIFGLSYKAVMLSNKLKGKNKNDVWLMLPENEADESGNRRFASLSFNGDGDGTDIQIETITHYIPLPAARGKRCFSFSDGWLLTYGEDYSTSLLHTLSGTEIELPGWDSAFDSPPTQHMFPTVIERAVLTADPSASSTNFQVIMLYISGFLAYTSPQDNAWKCLSSHLHLPLMSEIYVYNGKVHVMDWLGGLWLCDVTQGDEPVVTLMFQIDPEIGNTFSHYDFRDSYLVESLGELLVIFRKVDWDDEGEIFGTLEFRVFKLNMLDERWIELESLDNRSIFVGKNVSFSIDAGDVPGCKPNCIYFTQSCSYCFLVDANDYVPWGEEGSKDMGVYDLNDNSMKPYVPSSQCCSRVWPSIWVLVT